MLILGKFTIMSSMFIIAFISYLIGNLKQVRKIIKKINIKGLEIEFKNEKQKKFVDVAIELLENNFPILSNVGQEEVNKRVSAWLKDFLAEIEKQKIPVSDTKLFYDPDFQYVLNKAIETVARRNNKLINTTLITLLIERLKNSDKSDSVYINQINSVIIEDMPKLCEEHFKMLSAIYLFEHLSRIAKCDNIEYFQDVIISLLNYFIEEDAKCYVDLQRSNLVLISGNPKLNNLTKGLHFSENKNLYQSSNLNASFWDYMTNEYPFLSKLADAKKQELLNNKILKNCEIKFNKIYRYVLLAPISGLVFGDYFNSSLTSCDKMYVSKNVPNSLSNTFNKVEITNLSENENLSIIDNKITEISNNVLYYEEVEE